MNVKSDIPAEIRMFSGCEDKQTSADVGNVGIFKLPDPAGRAGGACTSAFLNVVYADHQKPDEDLSFRDVLTKMRTLLAEKNFGQIPQLSSSRPMNIEQKFDLSPDNLTGVKRAVIIGINYVGQNGELRGCHNDALNMIEYLKDAHGFEEKNMSILIDDDDDQHIQPTKANMLAAYKKIADISKKGDVAFLHYAGHGGSLRDSKFGGDEKDGYDETLIPLDFAKNGQIRDDELKETLIKRFRSGVFVTSMMDSCHSGTVLDLPYNFKADGNQNRMEPNDGYKPDDDKNRCCTIV